MPIDDRTTSRNYPKPNVANLLSEDVARLRSALDAIDSDVQARAPLASPALTGDPTAPTQAADNSTTRLATTAFVAGQAGTVAPVMAGTATVGTSLRFARQDHRHPTDTTRAALASPTFTGTPAAPTPAVDTNTTQLATTAFFIGQAGAVSPLMAGLAAAGSSLRFARQDHRHPIDTSRAPVASPTFTGTATMTTLVVSGVGSFTGTGAIQIPAGTTGNRPTPVLGQVRFNTSIGQFEGYNGSAWGTIGGGATGGGMRNLLINGNPIINQRGYVSGTATTGANQYTLDRWRVVTSGQNISFTDSANVRTVTAPAGGVEQVIEGLNIFSGTYTLNWTGTATATVGGTAVAKGGNVTLTGGTNVTVRFSGGTFSLAQLEPGTIATPFEQRPIGAELSLCQRYFQQPNEIPSWIAEANISGTSLLAHYYYPTTMRAAPTLVGGWTSLTSAAAGSITVTPNLIQAQLFATALGVMYSAGLAVTSLSAEL